MKIAVYIVGADGVGPRRICWYTGTSDAQVEMAIRMQLHVPQGIKFLLRDADADVVPVSSTLPNGHYYTLVLPEGLGFEGVMSTGHTTSGAINRTIPPVEQLSVMTQARGTLASSPTKKRRRLEVENVSSPATASPPINRIGSITTAMRLDTTPPRSIAPIIAQFADTFTQPIANDDNVSFIPNGGRFALYGLYCEIVRDLKFHPKREDVFYKMTSMYGKVDRQRLVRYYKCLAENGDETEFVQYKPHGKGVLLRKYRETGSERQLRDMVMSAPFISWLNLDPNDVMALYVRFIYSFTPIVRSEYKAQTSDIRLYSDLNSLTQ